MSRSYHQSHKISKKGSSSFVIEGDNRYKIKINIKSFKILKYNMIKLLNGKRRNILHTVNNEILILKVNQHIQMKNI